MRHENTDPSNDTRPVAALVIPLFDLWGRGRDGCQVVSLRASFLVCSLLVSTGCAGGLPAVWITDLPLQKEVTRILPGDTLDVQVKDQLKLSGAFPVRTNGTYSQPVVGELKVVGLTEQEAALMLSKNLKGIVVEPLVTISIGQRKAIKIPVLGEVNSVGTVTVELGDGMLQLIAAVGGLGDFANKSQIYVIRRDPRLIRIRFNYDALVGGDRKHVNFALKEGDVVVVK